MGQWAKKGLFGVKHIWYIWSRFILVVGLIQSQDQWNNIKEYFSNFQLNFFSEIYKKNFRASRVCVLLANKSVMSGNFANVKVPFDHDY